MFHSSRVLKHNLNHLDRLSLLSRRKIMTKNLLCWKASHILLLDCSSNWLILPKKGRSNSDVSHAVTFDLDKRDLLEPCEAYSGRAFLPSVYLEGSAAFENKMTKQFEPTNIRNKGSRLKVSSQFTSYMQRWMTVRFQPIQIRNFPSEIQK